MTPVASRTTFPTPAETNLPHAATVNGAVRLSGLSRTAIYQLLNDGTIEARKRGKTTLVLMEGVRRYVDSLPRATFASPPKTR